jgi:hypothetical protein
MMNRIKSLGAAVVALAAPVLLAAPAAADTRIETRLGNETTLTLALGSSDYDDYHRRDYRRGLNAFGQTDREVRALIRDASQACRQAVRYEAGNLGYHDVDFDDAPYVQQISRRGFLVDFDDVEFEGRRYDRETRVTCEVRRGEVISVEGIPRPHRGRPYPRGW